METSKSKLVLPKYIQISHKSITGSYRCLCRVVASVCLSANIKQFLLTLNLQKMYDDDKPDNSKFFCHFAKIMITKIQSE